MMNPATLQAMSNMQQTMGGMGGMAAPQQQQPGIGGLDFSQFLGGGAPSTPQPPADPAVTYASQITQLEAMGFQDRAANIRALTQTSGNVNAAVERLLG